MVKKRGVLTRTQAVNALKKAGLDLRHDYHQLSSSDVDKVLFVASLYGYRKSPSASGSKGRMFWQFMQRVAKVSY